jgi:hypothetical protein
MGPLIAPCALTEPERLVSLPHVATGSESNTYWIAALDLSGGIIGL